MMVDGTLYGYWREDVLLIDVAQANPTGLFVLQKGFTARYAPTTKEQIRATLIAIRGGEIPSPTLHPPSSSR